MKSVQIASAKMALARAVKPKVSVARKVAKLTRQVKKLNKVSYEPMTSVSVVASGDNLTSTYNAWNLSRLNPVSTYAIPLFGKTSTEINDVNRAYLNSKEIFVSIRQNNEPNLTRMSLFLVSLKDQGATATIMDPATRQLTLTGTSDFSAPQSEMAVLNSAIFTTHAVRRFTMGYEGSAGPEADTYSQRRFRFVIKPKQKLIENPVGNVFANSSFPSPTDPSQNYFIIIFNDNSSIDLEYPKCDISVFDRWALPN